MKKRHKIKILLASSLCATMLIQSVLPISAATTTSTSTSEKAKELQTIVIGQNLITNPTFDTDTGWEKGGWTSGDGGNVYITGGHYGVDPTVNGPYIQQKVTILEAGTYYLAQDVKTNFEGAIMQVLKGDDIVAFKDIGNTSGQSVRYSLSFDAEANQEYTIRVVAIAPKGGKYINGDNFYLGTREDGQEITVEIAEFDENGNLIANGDFSDGTNYWTTNGKINLQANNPPKFDGLDNDKNHWGMDTDVDVGLKRYIQIPQSDQYIFSHYIASSVVNSAKWSVKSINGDVIAEETVKGDGKYHKELVRFDADKGDIIEISVEGTKKGGWTNGDYFYLGLDNQNLITNNGFEDGNPEWNNANITSTKPFSGKYENTVDNTYTLEKNIKISKTGYYDLGIYVYNPEAKDDEKIILKKGNQIVKEITVDKNSYYERIYLHDLELTSGDYKLTMSGDNYLVDEIELFFNKEEIAFANILDIELGGRIIEKNINKYNKTIDIEYIYGDDLSKILVEDITVTDGVTVSIEKNDRIDLTKPYTVTLKTTDGNEVEWTINAQYSNHMISMTSSNKQLENFFNWAVNNLDQFVVTGQTGKIDNGNKPNAAYIPSYWAGYFNRTAFYSRDFVHQATGAQIAGLADENFEMFKVFAKNTTEERKWYTLWAFNFDGSPYYVDYESDSNFVREVPAQFELVEKAWNQYLWSGDERYINDPDLLNYYEKTVTSFIEEHDDQNPNGIAEGYGNLWAGTATYNERSSDWTKELSASGDYTIEAADGIACQYAAFVAYANILNARGETEKAEEWYTKADELKTYFNDIWSRVEDYDGDLDAEEFVLERTKQGRYRQGFAMETNYFIPLKGIVDPGERNDLALQMILDGLGTGIGYSGAPANVESYTYIPEMLYMYNWAEEGWDWIQYIDSIKDNPHQVSSQGTNGDYPEVSFTAISNVVEGMMGVSPNAGEHFIATLPRLAAEIPDATVKYMDIGGQLLHLTHTGNTASALTNTSDEDMTWEARFYGDYKYILIDGKYVEAKQKEINGELVSYAQTIVGAGKTVKASAANEIASYDVIIDAVEHGTITVDKTSAQEGETVTVTAKPDEGYTLKGITVDGKEIEGNTFKMKNQNVTVGAIFEKQATSIYSITIKSSEHGTITVDKTSAQEDETVTVTAKPDEGYALKAITVDGKEIEGNTFKMKNQNVIVSAVFEKKDEKVDENVDQKDEPTVNDKPTVKVETSVDQKDSENSQNQVQTSDNTSIVGYLAAMSLTGLVGILVKKYKTRKE